MSFPPNKALQRTRASSSARRSPLSFSTLGDAKRFGRWVAVVGVVLLLGAPSPAGAAEKRDRVTGLFSDMHWVEEAGDVVGTEVLISYSSGMKGHYWAYVQVAEGSPSPPVLVEATVSGDRVEFTLPGSKGLGHFVGKVTAKALVGKFDSSEAVVTLPRRKSYWQ